jgi:hypothetical protein
MPSAGFEPAIPATKLSQTYAATGNGTPLKYQQVKVMDTDPKAFIGLFV